MHVANAVRDWVTAFPDAIVIAPDDGSNKERVSMARLCGPAMISPCPLFTGNHCALVDGSHSKVVALAQGENRLG